MNKRKLLCIVLIFLTLSCTFLSLFSISSNNKNIYENNKSEIKELEFEDHKLKIANFSPKPLNYTSIYRNSTDGIIRRGFESIEFKINASGFFEDNGANFTIMQIKFANNTIRNFTMKFEYSHNFSYTYKPGGNAPLGFQIVKFYIYNKSVESGALKLLNTQTTLTNITIRSTSMVGFNSSEYTRGEYVLADITIDNSENFDWIVSVVNGTNEAQQRTIVEFTKNPFQISFYINDSYDLLEQFYYIKISMSESGGPYIADYFGFYVKNADPIVDENSIVFNPTSVFRTKNCVVRLNASDAETSQVNISVTLELYDTNNNLATSVWLDNNADGTFEGTFSVEAGRPIGNYEAKFNATDLDSGIGYGQKIITIKNNPPDIDGYEINDFDTDERIFVDYGDDLEFDDFDVTDVEGIAYITIELILEDPIGDEEDEYEITREYEEDLDITIRTEDLSAGTWTVYVSVTDTDGAITDLDDDFDTGPQQIEIIPDLISDVLPWVMLIVGSFIGIITGIGFGYYAGKSRYIKYKPEEEKVPPKKKPKKVEKPVKEKVPPTKPKPVEKEIKEEPEKEEPKKPTPKRKIKRKL